VAVVAAAAGAGATEIQSSRSTARFR